MKHLKWDGEVLGRKMMTTVFIKFWTVKIGMIMNYILTFTNLNKI